MGLGPGARGQGPVFSGDVASKRAEKCHPGSEQPFIGSKRDVNVSIFGFAFDSWFVISMAPVLLSSFHHTSQTKP